MQTRCLGSFSVMCVPKLLLTPVEIWNFGPKLTFVAKYRHFRPIWSKTDKLVAAKSTRGVAQTICPQPLASSSPLSLSTPSTPSTHSTPPCWYYMVLPTSLMVFLTFSKHHPNRMCSTILLDRKWLNTCCLLALQVL